MGTDLPVESPLQTVLTDDVEEPPGTSRRHPCWKDVPNEQWEDWRWQMQNAVRTTAQLAELIPVAAADVPILQELEHRYKLSIPPYYFSLIDPNNPDDPIRIQSVPTTAELTSESGQTLDDPLEEDKDQPVPGLTHRYPDRVLMVTTPVCSMYCRFCTRKRVTMDRDGWDGPSRDEVRMIEYIASHTEIHDVVVSGGDPLMLPIAKLRWFVVNLAAIPHVDVIRIGTRVPVTLPQKLFENEYVDLLKSVGKIWIQTHFNHPSEITPESERAIRNLVNAGMPVSNHAVLLKGVNDSVATMRSLVRNLLRIKARPYYLFHCDPVTGAGHMRTTIWKGLEIIEGLRGHVSGLGVPTYVVDGLHGAGKIPLMPNYLISSSDNAVVLRNYEGLLFRYAPEDKAGAVPEGVSSIGVSNLLSGNGKVLMPDGLPRMERRRAREADQVVIEPTYRTDEAPASAAPPELSEKNGTSRGSVNGGGRKRGSQPETSGSTRPTRARKRDGA